MAYNQTLTLSNEHIEVAVHHMQAFLRETHLSTRDQLRGWLALESSLLYYQDIFGADTPFVLQYGKRLGKQYISLTLDTRPVNPFDKTIEDANPILQQTLAIMGFAPSWQYSRGCNVITLSVPKVQRSAVFTLLCSILLAVACGGLCSFFPAVVRTVLSESVITPLSKTFTGMLTGISGPMIFLSVIGGIRSIGDASFLNTIGKRMVARFLLFSALAAALIALCLLPFFPPTTQGGGFNGSSFSALYVMVLNMLPDSMIAPFLTPNPMQIVMLAVVVGATMLVCSESTQALGDLMDQANNVVNFIITLLSKLVPFFIFITVLQMFLNGQFAAILRSYKWIVSTFALCLLIMICYTALTCFVTKVPPAVLIKKLLPTFLITVTTSSSAAAFPTNVEACEHKLGIDSRIIHFGLPLGQVVFMPGAIVLFFTAAVTMSNAYNVEMTPMVLLTTGIISMMLAIAAPPIPGGALTCYTILFTQIGLSTEAIAIVLALSMLTELIATASNIYCLQCELTLLGHSLGMLNHDTLRRPS